MYVIETKEGDWFCSESRKEIAKIVGKVVSEDTCLRCNNLWYQPWNYLSGVMSDFFCVIKDGVLLEKDIPMRNWHNDLPLSKCIGGGVEYIGGKEPKWYIELLAKNGIK